MGITNPRTRLILFSALLLLEIGLSIYVIISKGVRYSSFGDFLDGPLFLNSILIISFSVQAWQAYQETKKIQEGIDQ